MKKSSLAWPVALIVIGTYWLLKNLGLFPSTSSLVSGGLLALALVVFITDGLNKQSLVVGGMLMYLAMAIFLTSAWFLPSTPFWAGGMIFLGFLLLLARSSLLKDKQQKTINTP